MAYMNGLHNGFVSDDIEAIQQNRHITQIVSPLTNPQAFSTSAITALVYKIGGLDPAYYRGLNILFHMACTLLVYFIILHWKKRSTAFITAALFAVHPLLIESITWISGGPYPRYTFFLLLSFLCYISLKNKYWKLSLSLLFFVLATFFTEKAIAYPFVIILYELAFGSLKKYWKSALSFFFIDFLWLGYYVLRLQQRLTVSQEQYYLDKGYYNPLTQIPTAVTKYLQLIFWPNQLSFYQSEINFSLPEHIIRGLLTVLFFALIIYFYKKNRYIFFWLAFFFICLIPTMLPFKIAWVVAERYVYMSTIGILAIVGLLLSKLKENKWVELLYYPVIIGVVLALAGRTYIRNTDWLNEDTLWIATARSSPSDFKTHNNIAITLQKHSLYAQAEREFKIALKMNPRYADVYYNLGLLYYQDGFQTQKALDNYKKAIQYQPNFWQAYNGIAVVNIDNEHYDVAEQYIRKTISINPDFVGSYHNLGIVYDARGDYNQAITNYKKALSMDNTMWNTHFVLGRLYARLKEYKQAEQYLTKSLEINPEQPLAYKELSTIYAATGRPQLANEYELKGKEYESKSK
jgi:tetratricopeptide (TPR) repeat protein